MKKEDYKRLQKMALEINDIMLANGLHEITIETSHKTWNDNKNSIEIYSRQFDEYAKQRVFQYGSINVSSDVKEIEGHKYSWDYEDFIKKASRR